MNLAALTLGVFFIAQIMTFQIGRRLAVPLQPVFAPREPAVQKRVPKGEGAYAAILERNIFNLRPPAVSPGTLEPKMVVPVRLLGTVAGLDDFSYAIIEDPYQKVQKIFRVDDTIAPGIQLAAIGRNKIVILRDGVREEVEPGMGEAAGGRPSAAPPAPLPQAGIPQESPNNFLVDKREVEAATQDLNRLMTQARLVPNFSGGVGDGFRIFSIVPGSLYERAGIRNGDILQNINGVELKDPEKAFQIYQLLKDNDRFNIDLVRAGQKMTLNYEVR